MVSFLLFFVFSLVGGEKIASAQTTCPTLPTDNVTATVTIPTTGTYTVWSRLYTYTSTNNSYYLQVDSQCGIDVGDNDAMATNTWTWVNYRDGSTSTPITMSLTAGSHTVKMITREPNVTLDRVIFSSDPSCIPSGTGDTFTNCSSTATPIPATNTPVPPTATPTNTPTPTPNLTYQQAYATTPANTGTTTGWANTLIQIKTSMTIKDVEFYGGGSGNTFEIRSSNSFGTFSTLGSPLATGTLGTTASNGFYAGSTSKSLAAGYYVVRVNLTNGKYYYGSTTQSYTDLSFLRHSKGTSYVNTAGPFQIRLGYSKP